MNRNNNNSAAKKFGKAFISTAIVGLVILFGLCVGSIWGRAGDVESLCVDSMSLNLASTVVYLNQQGEEVELENLFSEQYRVWVDYDQIPEYLKKAVVAIEDERFYRHKGFDPKRTVGAVLSVIKAKLTKEGCFYGGSTITQQLIKNLTGERQNTASRKIQEILRAVNYEKRYSKDQILELYLNTIYLSQGCNGVQAAAKTYFDKEVCELSLAQCASLVGITQFPAKYDPLTNPEANKDKQKIILQKMLQLDYISQEEYDKAIEEPLIFSKNASSLGVVHSYFIDQVINDVLAMLKKKGYSEVAANKMLFAGGLKIISTYDPRVQNAVDKIYCDINNFPKQNANEKPQSAIVVLDSTTGAVCGIAGGIGPKAASRTLNRATQSLRQPGSIIKPLSVYSLAFDMGLINPYSIYEDKEMNFQGFTPQNYDRKYRGEVTVQYSIVHSLNTIPVRILNDMGVDKSFNFLANRLGITSLVAKRVDRGQIKTDRALSPLALGGLTDGISPLEIAGAYGVFSNKGIYNKPYFFTQVHDNSGKTIIKVNADPKRAVKESTSYTVSGMLNLVISSGTGMGAQVANGMYTCGKTGTTSDNCDRWFAGYTPYYTCAIWFGYDQPRSLGSIANPCIPVFKKVMDMIHNGLAPKNGAYKLTSAVNICQDSGKLATDFCEHDERGNRVISATFADGAAPKDHCDLHIQVWVDNATGMIATEFCPSENVVQKIMLKTSNELPAQQCTLHTAALSPTVTSSPKFTSSPSTSPTPLVTPSDSSPIVSTSPLHTND